MSYTPESFLAAIKDMVIADMKNTGILASLTAAQALLESGRGNSTLAAPPNNNLFGIKGTYNGAYVLMNTREWNGKAYVTVKAKFRKYPSWKESIADHSALFNRYARYKNLRGCKDYKLACKYVKDDGYATSPTYTSSLITIIERYGLYKWDSAETLASGTILTNKVNYAVTITAEHGLNVRAGAGNSFGIMQVGGHNLVLPCGMVIAITEEKNGWGRVGGTDGYVALGYVKK